VGSVSAGDFLTVEEAVERLDVFEMVEYDANDEPMPGPGLKRVHTFLGGRGLTIGADWDLADVIAEMGRYRPEPSGPSATAMGHGIVLADGRPSPLFLATKAGKR
jgi:hypothetical protein